MSQQFLVLYGFAIGCVLSSLPLTRVDKTHCRHWGNGSHFAAHNFFVCRNVALATRATTARTKVAQTGNDYDRRSHHYAIACTDNNCRNCLPSLISFPTCRQSIVWLSLSSSCHPLVPSALCEFLLVQTFRTF